MSDVDPCKTRSCATNLVCHICSNQYSLDSAEFKCCGKTLDVAYDYELAKERLAEPATRSRNVWAHEELLPIRDFAPRAKVGFTAGATPLIPAERLAAELGVRRIYIKDDSTQRPSLSYKDRVCAMGIARLLELGKDRVACVSTGNVGVSMASLAASVGVEAIVFYPSGLEAGKLRACKALGARVIELDGTFDDVNAMAKELVGVSDIEVINVSLRPYYAEGAKTIAYEIVRTLGHSPDHIVTPAAGGTLSSRIHKGLREVRDVMGVDTDRTKLHIAQPEGCSPITTAIRTREVLTAQEANTRAQSLAIGNPGDGHLATEAALSRGGFAAAPTDAEIFEAIDLLAKTQGILVEPAGGTTLAATIQLINEGRIGPDETAVLVMSGSGYKVLEDLSSDTDVEKSPCEVDAVRQLL